MENPAMTSEPHGELNAPPVGPCCFCGEKIAVEAPEPVTVSLEAANARQTFYAHMACVENHVKRGNGVELNLR
jgi:hypothetical protein